MFVLAALLLALLPMTNGVCDDITKVQQQLSVDAFTGGTLPWICTPPAGELKLAPLQLAALTETHLPVNGDYREKVDTEPTIKILCKVPASVAQTLLLASVSKAPFDIQNLTISCAGVTDGKVYFSMKDRVLVGPAPECKKVQVVQAANGTYSVKDYTGSLGPVCVDAETVVTTASSVPTSSTTTTVAGTTTVATTSNGGTPATSASTSTACDLCEPISAAATLRFAASLVLLPMLLMIV